MVPNHFKHRLSTPGAALGTWLMSVSATCAEAVGWTGLDFVVVDMEHVPLDLSQMVDLLRALASTPVGVVTRVPWNEPVIVKRVLDAGAQTLMFPMVQTVEEARAAVSATRYPPHGIRGVAAVHRASRFGAVPDYLRSSGPELEVIVQVETPQAWERMADIASVDGVDAVFIGPSDLSANMGHLGNLAHPDVQDRVMRAPAIIHAQGRKAGVLVPSMDLARQCAAQGYDFVAIGSDLSAMLAGVRGHVQAWGAKDSALPMVSATAPTGSAY